MARIKSPALVLLIMLPALTAGSPTPANELVPSADVIADAQQLLTDHYHQLLQDYDAKLAVTPGDVMLAIERCKVIESYTYFEDFYIADAFEADEACRQALQERFVDHPEVALLELSTLYGDEGTMAAQEILHGDTKHWNRSQLARLHLYLANNTGYDESKADLSGRHCLSALSLDIRTDCRLLAARYHNFAGDDQRAVDVLSSALDPHDAAYYVADKIGLLFEFGASAKALELYRQAPDKEWGSHYSILVAQHLATTGELELAQLELDRVDADDWNADRVALVRFETALAGADLNLALSRYNEMRDAGYDTDPVLRHRLALAVENPRLPWKLRDAVGLAALLGCIALIGLLAATIPALVHYRGLIRITQGKQISGRDPAWSLRLVWFAIFVVLIGSFASLYFYQYEFLVGLLNGSGMGVVSDLSNAQFLRSVMAETTVVSLLLAPVLLRKRRWTVFGTPNWSVGRCLLIGVGFAILFRILFSVSSLELPDPSAGRMFATDRLLKAMELEYGALWAFLYVAAFVPVYEELIFRGIVLRGFSKYISGFAANLLQALLFASLHEGVTLFPLYVALGLVLGSVSRRAGGLLPAIILHTSFNATAMVYLLL